MAGKSRADAARQSAGLAAASLGGAMGGLAAAPDDTVVAMSQGGELVEFSRVKSIPLARIGKNPRNDYDSMSEEEIQDLANSMRKVGILNPVILRPTQQGDNQPAGIQYVLICGENRTNAAPFAGFDTAPARIVVRPSEVSPELEDEIMEGENDRRRKKARPNKKREFIRTKYGARIESMAAGGSRSAGQFGGNLAEQIEKDTHGKIPKGTAQRLIAEIRKEKSSASVSPASKKTVRGEKAKKAISQELQAATPAQRNKLKSELMAFLSEWAPKPKKK